MRATTATITAGLLATLTLSGCATSGQLRDVRETVAEQGAALEASISTERAARMAADERLAADLTVLRTDLQSMESEFNASIEAVARGLQFALPVHLAFDDASVRAQDRAALERFAQIVSRHYTGAVVTVEGFADPAGPASYNRALSKRRADAVREHLMRHGIQAQVRTVGYGAERQVVEGARHNDPGAELNRRVVFVIESPTSAAAVSLLEQPDR